MHPSQLLASIAATGGTNRPHMPGFPGGGGAVPRGGFGGGMRVSRGGGRATASNQSSRMIRPSAPTRGGQKLRMRGSDAPITGGGFSMAEPWTSMPLPIKIALGIAGGSTALKGAEWIGGKLRDNISDEFGEMQSLSEQVSGPSPAYAN